MSKPVIRDVTLKDAAALSKIYAYYVNHTAITYEYDAPDESEFKERIKNITARYPYFVLEDNGIIKGYAYASAFHPRKAYEWCAEVTIYLDHEAFGRGYGRLLYAQLEKALKEMGILNLYACIAHPEVEDEYLNKNSEQFHRHMGYELIGTFKNSGYKFNRWYHMIWMEKIIGEHLVEQPPVRWYGH